MAGSVVHCRRAPFDVYIGRPSKWGNPYSHLPDTLARFRTESRQEALEKYEAYIRSSPELIAALVEIRGKTLGCWCHPKPCHGSILLRLAEEYHGFGALFEYE